SCPPKRARFARSSFTESHELAALSRRAACPTLRSASTRRGASAKATVAGYPPETLRKTACRACGKPFFVGRYRRYRGHLALGCSGCFEPTSARQRGKDVMMVEWQKPQPSSSPRAYSGSSGVYSGLSWAQRVAGP